MRFYIKASYDEQLDTQIKNYLGHDLIASFPAEELGCGRGGYVYIFHINNNAYRVFCDTLNNEMIFQLLQYGFYDDNGEECFDVACDYESIAGEQDSWFTLFKQWIDECEMENPNFTEWEGEY